VRFRADGSWTTIELRRYQRAYLEQSFSNLLAAVELTEHGHQTSLSSLIDCQGRRYERIGELTDLHRTISNLRELIQYNPNEPKKS
jgi:hypothetical protein